MRLRFASILCDMTEDLALSGSHINGCRFAMLTEIVLDKKG